MKLIIQINFCHHLLKFQKCAVFSSKSRFCLFYRLIFGGSINFIGSHNKIFIFCGKVLKLERYGSDVIISRRKHLCFLLERIFPRSPFEIFLYIYSSPLEYLLIFVLLAVEQKLLFSFLESMICARALSTVLALTQKSNFMFDI